MSGKEKHLWSLHGHLTYLSYLGSRAVFHARALPTTLFRGVRRRYSAFGLDGKFWIFYAASFCFDFGMFIFFVLFNLFLVDCGFTEKFVGMATSAVAAGSIVGTIPAGIVAQRFGLRKALLGCFAMLAGVSALRTLFVGEGPQLVLAFLAGVAGAVWAVCLSPALAQLTTEQSRPLGFSLVFSFGIGEGAIGGLIGGHLPGWLARVEPGATPVQLKRFALLISCAIVALGLLPLSRLRFPSAPAPPKTFYPRNPFLLRFLAAMALWGLVIGAFTPFANIYFSQHLQMSLAQVGTVFSASQLSQVVAILAAPVVIRKFGIVTGIIYMQLATAVTLGCLARASTAASAAIAYTCYMAFQWMSEPGMFTLLMNRMTPAEQTGASSLNFLVASVTNAIAATIAGAYLARFGYPVVLWGTAGLALIAALVFQLLLSSSSAPNALLGQE